VVFADSTRILAAGSPQWYSAARERISQELESLALKDSHWVADTSDLEDDMDLLDAA
jgi:hypothetical protein